jgi:cobalt-zinc-cadmium resistance protein CzcA
MMTEVPDMEGLPELDRYENQVQALEKQYRLEQQNLFPGLTLEYFQGNNGRAEEALTGYKFGLKIPVLFNGQASRIRAARLAADAFTDQQRDYERRLVAKIGRLRAEREQQEKALMYYEEEGLLLSETILRTAESSFKNGEINFFQYIQSLENGYEISLDYLDQLQRYNEIILQINYLTL